MEEAAEKVTGSRCGQPWPRGSAAPLRQRQTYPGRSPRADRGAGGVIIGPRPSTPGRVLFRAAVVGSSMAMGRLAAAAVEVDVEVEVEVAVGRPGVGESVRRSGESLGPGEAETATASEIRQAG